MNSSSDSSATTQKIDRYVLKSVLGRGSTGVVYLAFDPATGKDLSLKIHRASPQMLAVWPALNRDFRNLAAKLQHQSIPAIIDLGVHENNIYQVLEFIPGTSLDQLLESGSDCSQILSVLGKVAEAIDLAHSLGLLHSDLKPANFILSNHNQVYILDFGFSILRSSFAKISGTENNSSIIGTPAYLAPEQITDRHSDYSSDLFSFATLVFQILTGQLPFDGTSYNEISHNIVSTPEKQASRLNKELGSGVDEIFKRALNKDSSQRFKTAKEFIDALMRVTGKESRLRPLAPTAQIFPKQDLQQELQPSERRPQERRPVIISSKYKSLPTIDGRVLKFLGIMAIAMLVIVAVMAIYPRKTSLVLEQDPDISEIVRENTSDSTSTQQVIRQEPIVAQEAPLLPESETREFIQKILQSTAGDPELPGLLETLQKSESAHKDKSFVRLFNHPGFLVKVAVIKNIIEGRLTEFLPEIRNALKDNDPIVRGFSAKALGILGEQSDKQLLSSLIAGEKQPEARQAMINALKRLQSE